MFIQNDEVKLRCQGAQPTQSAYQSQHQEVSQDHLLKSCQGVLLECEPEGKNFPIKSPKQKKKDLAAEYVKGQKLVVMYHKTQTEGIEASKI